jgi:tryptophan synthase beta chain
VKREKSSMASTAAKLAVEERFGPYGGRYVPETLIPALDELSAAWSEARGDEEFTAELAGLHRDFIGRPTPLYPARASRSGRAGAST